MLSKIYTVLRSEGVDGVVHAARRAISPPRARCLELCQELIRGKRGLEVGGPSGVFRAKGLLPIYPVVSALDNCNFAHRTTWEGVIATGQSFRFAVDRAAGRQYVSETTDLSEILSGTYDFLLSSHVIEHTANPVQALGEWMRVLGSGGILVVLVPHRDGTFDHRRPVTALEHLFEDFERRTQEDDLTHLDEILRLHDLRKDPAAGTAEQFRIRSEKNLEHRCLHHHVFDTRLVIRLLDRLGLQILAAEAARPNHILAIARKPGAHAADNRHFLADGAPWQAGSPFASDRS